VINIQTERVYALADLPRRLPRRRGGKRIHVSTLFRWAKTGLRARDGRVVHLAVLRIGGTLCSTVEAIQRFAEELTCSSESGSAIRAGTQKSMRDARTERELKRRGL
jgi:hypothetical protein